MNYEREFSSNSPLIVAEPGQPRFVVMANRLDAPDFSCALQVSGDSGRTWLTADPVPDLPKGAEKCYAPEVAFDGHGTLYYLFVGLANPGNRPMGAFLVTSTDRAKTFSRPRRVLGPLNFSVRMAIDPEAGDRGRIHLVWIATGSEPSLGGFGPGPNPIRAAHSDDGGKTFSEPVQVSDPDRGRVVAPALALGADRRVHVAYYDLGRDAVDYQGLEGPAWGEPWTLVLATSPDGGLSFGRGGVVDEQIMAPERVMLIFTMPPPALVAGTDGAVCTAWTDARHGDPDAIARCSPDHGRTWPPARRLNDDRTGNGASQYLPRLALSSDGRLDAAFLDRRDDARNVLNRVFVTYSVDGGRRFSPNKRISRAPSDSRIGQQYVHPAAEGQYEIGARLGLLSQASHALVAWPDSRHWAKGETGQDLFSATVAMPEPRGPSLVVRLVGGASTLAGLAALATLAVRSSRRGASRGDGLRARLAAGLAVAGMLVLAGCRAPERGAALPGRPSVVDVAMSEYRFEHRSTIAAGRVLFRVRNVGAAPHSLRLLPLPEDMPPILEQLRGAERRSIVPHAAIKAQRPSATTTFAVDLPPGGRYALVCFVNDDQGVPHALRGMASEFRTPK